MMPDATDKQDETRCPETRGYCQCDKVADGHRFHHCPECAAHPNGGYAFATWRVRPEKPGKYRHDESMHEYTGRANDPWAERPGGDA